MIGFLLINRPIFLVVVSDLKWIEMQNWKMSPGKFIHDKTRPNCLLKMVLVACTISVQKSISCVLSIHHFTYFYCTSQYKVQHIVLLFLYEFFNFQFCDFLVNMGVDDKKLFFIIFRAKALWHCLTSCQFDLILDVWTSSKIWRLYIWTCEMLSLFPSIIISSKLNFGLSTCLIQSGSYNTLSILILLKCL